MPLPPDTGGVDGRSPATPLEDIVLRARGGLLGLSSSCVLKLPPGTGGVAGRSLSLLLTTVASLWLDPGRGCNMGPSLLNLGAAGKVSVLLGAAKLFRLLANEFPRASPDGSWALHRFDTLSDRFIIALCTKPPSPFVGDDDLERSGESRLGDMGDVCSSELGSVFVGSSFCALDRGIGEPRPVAVDTEDTLEYRLLILLSANIELARDGERDRATSGSSCWVASFSGSGVFSTSGTGSLLLLASKVVSGTISSAGLLRIGEPRVLSVGLSGGGSLAAGDNAFGLRGAA